MWCAIGRAAARQARVGGRLVIRSASRLAAQPVPRAAPAIPSGIRVAVVFARGFAQRGRPRKDAAATSNTAAKKKAPAAKKKPAAKKAAKKKAARRKAELTDEEKTKLRIRELKKKALLKEQPAGLPTSAWMVYSAQRLKDLANDGNTQIITLMPKVAAEYKTLSAAELEKLAATSEQNKVTNEANLRNWIDNHTPQEIHDANSARHMLRRKYNTATKPTLNDPRFPKQPLTPYLAFVKSRYNSPELQDVEPKAKMSRLASDWKKLVADERKPFDEIAATDNARFHREKEAMKGELGQQ